jgi:hypothetical protein
VKEPRLRGDDYLTGTACHRAKKKKIGKAVDGGKKERKKERFQQPMNPLFGLWRLRTAGLDNASGVVRSAHLGFEEKRMEKCRKERIVDAVLWRRDRTAQQASGCSENGRRGRYEDDCSTSTVFLFLLDFSFLLDEGSKKWTELREPSDILSCSHTDPVRAFF